jgi:hypothetical protein
VQQRQALLERKFPRITELYQRIIEPRFKAAAGNRNRFIVEATPFIYNVVGMQTALALLDFFYEVNRHLFNATPERHSYECKKMIESVSLSYRDKLSESERAIYLAIRIPNPAQFQDHERGVLAAFQNEFKHR